MEMALYQVNDLMTTGFPIPLSFFDTQTSLAVEEYLTAHPEEVDKVHMLVHTGGVQGMRGLLHEMTLALGKDRSAVLSNAMDEFLSMLPGRMRQV